MAEDAKTYVFDSASKGSIDPATLLAMMNNNGGFGGNGSWLWVIFLFFLYGWGGNGMFGRGNGSGLANEINNDYGRDLLLQAINGNGTAISQLATTLNCDVNAIQTAINSVSSQIQSVGTQVGMSGQQVINAIQMGNQTLASQLASCCCENKLLVTNQGYENRIATAEQTSILGAKIDAQTELLSSKFCDLEKRELQSKVDALRERNSALQGVIDNANQTNQIQGYIASVVNPLTAEVASIKCRLPETVNVPYSPVTTIPSCLAYQYGLNGLYGNGVWA